MSAVIFKMIGAPGTFDDGGWLTIGFCGHQPSLAESYISTGSLYLCATALLPLGLSPSDAFWSAPAKPFLRTTLSSSHQPRVSVLHESCSTGLGRQQSRGVDLGEDLSGTTKKLGINRNAVVYHLK